MNRYSVPMITKKREDKRINQTQPKQSENREKVQAFIGMS